MRTAHAATTYAHFMIIFGGWNGERELDDVFSFDTGEARGCGTRPTPALFEATQPCASLNVCQRPCVCLLAEALLWRELKGSGPGPSGRHFPALAVVRKQLMVFGGFNGTHWCNDVHVMNLGESRPQRAWLEALTRPAPHPHTRPP